MSRSLTFGTIDALVVFGALVWLGVGWPIGAAVGFLLGSTTMAVFLLLQRAPVEAKVEQRWYRFVWGGSFGLLAGGLMLAAGIHPVVVVLEITSSLLMLGFGVYLRGLRKSASPEVDRER